MLLANRHIHGQSHLCAGDPAVRSQSRQWSRVSVIAYDIRRCHVGALLTRDGVTVHFYLHTQITTNLYILLLDIVFFVSVRSLARISEPLISSVLMCGTRTCRLSTFCLRKFWFVYRTKQEFDMRSSWTIMDIFFFGYISFFFVFQGFFIFF